MAFFLSLYLFSLVGFFIHLFWLPAKERTKARIIELLLLYQIVFSLGLTSLFAFIGFVAIPDYIADFTGWPECPFEIELANVNLAFGVLGIMSIWLRGHFWTATVLGFSIWIFADGIHHIVEAFLNHNHTDGNIGVPLITDLVVPVILVILLRLYLLSNPPRR